MNKKNLFIIISIFSFLLVFCGPVYAYEQHTPIIIEHLKTTPSNPLIIEGYEITNPSGPCIQVRHVDYVIVRNNYIHDCGTDISKEIENKIRNGEGDARLAVMNDTFSTGGIHIFSPLSVEVSNNEIINNDFGIRIDGHEQRIQEVTVNDNIVKRNRRSHFIWVQYADKAEIYNNEVKDNGLSLFIDNDGMREAFARGEDFADGRVQGIVTIESSNVKIYNNTVINSSSDGIAAVGGDGYIAENIEIYDNVVLRNAEQGVWVLEAKNGKIYRNVISENTHRIDTTGGSSGLDFDGGVSDFKIFDNEISYNDMFGVAIANSGNNEFYDNEIHHNVDGAFGWYETVHFTELVRYNPAKEGVTTIRDNNIYKNTMSVFGFLSEPKEKQVSVYNNRFTANGGMPVHYKDYADSDFSIKTHPEIWTSDQENIAFLDKDKDIISSKFDIGTNIIDGKEIAGTLIIKDGAEKIYAALIFIILLLLIFMLVLYYKKKR